tara:strand:+ start:3306 stop:4421 length:1116 start_codon:yes stop_codon:yes gene_type:complete
VCNLTNQRNQVLKKTFLFLLIIVSFSCQDDISNEKFRNSNYAFYQEDGKEGKWKKVVANSEMDFPKSKSTYFFDNGNRYAELTVLDSFPNRVSKFYDTDDNLIITERYSNDSLIEEKYVDGHYRGYYSNKGNLKSEGNIRNNKREGTWSFYKEDGTTLKHTAYYVDNLPNGLRKDYYDTGELKVSIYYKEGEKNGKAIHYYKNQQIEESKTYKNGKENGKVLKYFEDGSTKFSATFWNGKEIDTSRMYYPNGTLKQIFICIPDTLNNHFEGKLHSYYNSGVSKAYIELTNYKLNGIVKTYNKNGKLTEFWTAKNDERTGEFAEYYDNGKTKIIGNYKSGYYDEQIKYYNKNGVLTKTVNYQEGTALDSITY